MQASFKGIVAEQVQAIRDAHPDERVRCRFEDEARFGQRGTMARVRARKGSRPRAVKQARHGYLYVLTAVCAATGMASGWVASTLNVGAINALPKQSPGGLPAGVHAVPIRDGTGYPAGPRPVVPSNVGVIRPGPYSPGPDPAEGPWHYPRGHYRSSGVCNDHEALEGAAMDARRRVCPVPELARSTRVSPCIALRECA